MHASCPGLGSHVQLRGKRGRVHRYGTVVAAGPGRRVFVAWPERERAVLVACSTLLVVAPRWGVRRTRPWDSYD